jgi:hypothetical protein
MERSQAAALQMAMLLPTVVELLRPAATIRYC